MSKWFTSAGAILRLRTSACSAWLLMIARSSSSRITPLSLSTVPPEAMSGSSWEQSLATVPTTRSDRRPVGESLPMIPTCVASRPLVETQLAIRTSGGCRHDSTTMHSVVSGRRGKENESADRPHGAHQALVADELAEAARRELGALRRVRHRRRHITIHLGRDPTSAAVLAQLLERSPSLQ